jgi:hypothetical protein
MILCRSDVQQFCSEIQVRVFCVLANLAWTYLLHEYYLRKMGSIVDENGFSMPLSEMIERKDCPLSDGIKQNLRALKTLRDKVEHHLLGKADTKWLGLFQACCLNFDKAICDLFGPRMTLASDLAFALQFSGLNLDQVVTTNKYELPPEIEAIGCSDHPRDDSGAD